MFSGPGSSIERASLARNVSTTCSNSRRTRERLVRWAAAAVAGRRRQTNRGPPISSPLSESNSDYSSKPFRRHTSTSSSTGSNVHRRTDRFFALILRRPLHSFDDKHVDRPCSGLQFEAELLPQCLPKQCERRGAQRSEKSLNPAESVRRTLERDIERQVDRQPGTVNHGLAGDAREIGSDLSHRCADTPQPVAFGRDGALGGGERAIGNRRKMCPDVR